MEQRGKHEHIVKSSSIVYNPCHQPNPDSSSNLSSPTILSAVSDRRNENDHGTAILSPTQTLNNHPLHQHHQFNLQYQHQRPLIELSPNPDPDPPQPETSTIAGATNSRLPPPPPQPLPPPKAETQTTIRYRECQKNHAASMGGHVIDGCGEFMPSGEDGAQEALKCAACECHRNFHRREVEGELQYPGNCYHTYNYDFNPNRNNSQRTTSQQTQPPQTSLHTLPPQQHPQLHRYSNASPIPPPMMTFGRSSTAGAPAESSSEDLNMFQSNAGAKLPTQLSFSASKKRFRTKFTREQKDRMHEFAEKLGWKIQKQDDQEVQQFCDELGLKRQVFKVWMHNNKQAMKNKQL